jgi:hypothetical protein
MKGWNKEEIKETKEENNRIIMSSGSGSNGSSESESSSSDSNNNIIMLKNNNNNDDIEKDNDNDNYNNDNDNDNNNYSNDAMVVVAANAKPGSIIITLEEEDLSSNRQIIIENNNNKTQHQSTRSIMRDKKKLDTYDLAEDVYAFIFVSPIMSVPFFFSLYVIAVKIIIYSILISDINFSNNVTGGSKTATAAKFFLIPVRTTVHILYNVIHITLCSVFCYCCVLCFFVLYDREYCTCSGSTEPLSNNKPFLSFRAARLRLLHMYTVLYCICTIGCIINANRFNAFIFLHGKYNILSISIKKNIKISNTK